VPSPTQPSDDLPGEAVTQLNEGLKVCQKVVTEYRAALSRNQAATQPADGNEDAGSEQQD